MAISALQPKFSGTHEGMSEAEWQTRCELAACYQLAALYGMSDMAGTHISAQIPGTEGQYLLNPFELFFEEITASSLLKVDHTGKVLSDHSGPLNLAGFKIHGAVHMARPDLKCIMHTHADAINGVGMQVDGLLPLNQKALTILGFVAYHDFEGPAVGMQSDEQDRLLKVLGDGVRCVIMRNHGGLTVGASISEAFVWMAKLEGACRAQLLAQASGARLIELSQDIIERSMDVGRRVYGAGGMAECGPLEWPALIRQLERERGTSYRT
jgi:ribulose-5-phosphate 4-epimerase/fuculose-1-phosphate aldolase